MLYIILDGIVDVVKPMDKSKIEEETKQAEFEYKRNFSFINNAKGEKQKIEIKRKK